MTARRRDPALVGVTLVALVGGLLVLYLATDLFPFHSSNHDEGVYLQHARVLLSGRLWMTTPLPETFQHWFFVQDGTRLYSKYQPVVPALFAVGVAAGAPRVVLAAVGAGVVALVGLLTREAFDGRHAVVASALVVASPLFLLNTATFLPYAPTTLANLAFAYAYVRARRSPNTLRWATLAGLAVGLAFFARPFTAVLFALPFVAHAVWTLVAARDDPGTLRARFVGLLPTAALGLAFVALAFAYNAVLTGEPLVFPYQAFAPTDGIGFGHREILGYERDYTVALALRANARVLWEFATRWTVAPPLGTLVALAGAGLAFRRQDGAAGSRTRLTDHRLRLLLLGVAVSVVVGNVAFWGNLNVLADISDPTDGLIAQFGPFYHYDLLLPLSAFGAVGLLAGCDAVRAGVERLDGRRSLAVLLALVAVVTPVAAAAQAGALARPVEENRAYTERFADAYEPMVEQGHVDPPEGVLLVETPYGPWLGHPFQALYNEGDLDGETVVALDRGADATFALVDAYPDRSLHRFTYRGEWGPDPRGEMYGAVQPLDVRSGGSPTVAFETGVVGRPSTVRLSDGDEAVRYRVAAAPNDSFTVRMRIERSGDRGRASLVSSGLVPTGETAVSFEGSDELSVAVTYVQAGGATVTYRADVSADVSGDGVRVVWPPEVRVCRLTPDCGHEGTYLPGRGEYLDGVRANVSLTGV